jgi:hypothetical protein
MVSQKRETCEKKDADFDSAFSVTALVIDKASGSTSRRSATPNGTSVGTASSTANIFTKDI